MPHFRIGVKDLSKYLIIIYLLNTCTLINIALDPST